MAYSNPYQKRGYAGFGALKPLQLEAPVRRQQEEEQPSWMSAIAQALPAAIGGVKGMMNKDVPALTDTAKVIEGLPNKNIGEMGTMENAQRLMAPQEKQLSPYERARGEYESAINAPVEKKSWWKDALYKGAVIASNMFNPQNQLPVVGLGRAQKTRDIGRAAETFAPMRQLEEQRQADERNQSVIQDRQADNQRLQQRDQQRADMEARTIDLKERTQSWKQEDRDKYYEWERVKQTAKQSNDDRTYELAVRKQTEIERNNVASEAGKTQRTQMMVDGQAQRQQSQQTFTAQQNAIRMQMQKEIKNFEEANKNQRQAEANAARERLAKLKAEYEGLQ